MQNFSHIIFKLIGIALLSEAVIIKCPVTCKDIEMLMSYRYHSVLTLFD